MKDGSEDHRAEQRPGWDAQPDRGPGAERRHGRRRRQRRGVVDARHRDRVRTPGQEQPGDRRCREYDERHPQVLHQRDDARVGAVVGAHGGHRRCAARRGTPGGRHGWDRAEARQQPARQGGGGDRGEDDQHHHAPRARDRAENRRREGLRDQRPDRRLRGGERDPRQPDGDPAAQRRGDCHQQGTDQPRCGHIEPAERERGGDARHGQPDPCRRNAELHPRYDHPSAPRVRRACR